MTFTSFVQKTLKGSANFVYEKMAKNPGNMLLITGTAGWALSAIAQGLGVVNNKNISKEQKKFLLPQEISDAAVNIISFFVITKACTRLGEGLVKSGKLLTPKLREKLGLQISDISKKDFNISGLKQIIDKSDPNFNESLSKDYFKFFDGVSFLATTAGSILSCNLVTPYLRNKIASTFQKQEVAKDKTQLQNKELSPYTPVMPMQNRFSMADYRAKIGASSGSMRI